MILDSEEGFGYNTTSVTEPMKRYAYFLPAAIYYLLIFLISSGDYDIPIDVRLFDKSAHFVEFAILAFLLSLGFFHATALSARIKVILSFLIALGLGALDEFHQYFVPGREVEILDVMADGLGAACGALAYWLLFRRKKRMAGP